MLNYFYLILYAVTVLLTVSAWTSSLKNEYFWVTIFISVMYAGAWTASIWHEPDAAMFVDLCAMLALYILLGSTEIGRRLIFFTFLMVVVDAMSYAFLSDIPRGTYYAKTALNVLFICQCFVSIVSGIKVLNNEGDADGNSEKTQSGHRKVLQ